MQNLVPWVGLEPTIPFGASTLNQCVYQFRHQGIKYNMKHPHEVELINQLLISVAKKHRDPHAQMIYERGYLTGLLASFLSEDSQLRSRVIKRTNELLKNSGRS